MRKNTRARKKQRALTLIELLVTLALVGVVLAAAAAMLLQAYTGEASYRQQNNVQQNARRAADIVAADARGAKRVLVTSGSATLPTGTVMGASGTPTSTSPLYFNVFNDAGAERRVRYWLNGTDLRRDVVAYVDETTTPGTPSSATAGMVVARNISAFTATKPNYNMLLLDVTATDGGAPPAGSRSSVHAVVTLRNNLL